MDDTVNDAGGDVGMWDNTECEPITTPAPLATLANDPTDDLIGNFSMISIQLDDEESANTLPQALLTPALMQMLPPQVKLNLALASTLPATHVPHCAATQATPSISATTSTATSTSMASTMSTSTASSMATSAGAPTHCPPGTPNLLDFTSTPKCWGRWKKSWSSPRMMLQNLLLGMAAGKPPATNLTSSTGQGDPDSEMNAPLEFESEPGSNDLQGTDDSGSLSDPPDIEGKDVGCGSKVDNMDDEGGGGGGGEGQAKGQGVGRGAAGDSSTKNSKASLSIDEAVDEGEEMGKGPCHSTRNRNPSNDTTDKGKALAKAPAAAKPTMSSWHKK
ncbi:hypothetical protein FRC10_012229 [Ceratobasidium sp. 414]|nr:hypothetical protein FRC10_012229 [Ceratobasidium sp. 414]